MENGQYAYYFNNSTHGDDLWLVKDIGPDSVLDAVLDGVSLGERGAASLTASKLRNGNIQSPEDAARLLQEANEELFDRTSHKSQTTATITLKIGDELYTINTGDSPAYLMREGTCIKLATLDKIPYHPAAITNAVGIGRDFRYHENRVQLRPGDRVVIATDGITDNVYPTEVADIVYRQKTPDGAVRELGMLLEAKRRAGSGRRDVFGTFKEDDATAIVRYFP